jgi:hypothetical protein
VVHQRGLWQWAFDLGAAGILAERLEQVAPFVTYIGRRGSFVQFRRLFRATAKNCNGSARCQARFAPLGVRTMAGAFARLAHDLEECSRVHGAAWSTTFRRIPARAGVAGLRRRQDPDLLHHHPARAADGRRITYALDGTATAGDLVSRLAEVAALRDISVLEPAIEDVVARLYTRQPS